MKKLRPEGSDLRGIQHPQASQLGARNDSDGLSVEEQENLLVLLSSVPQLIAASPDFGAEQKSGDNNDYLPFALLELAFWVSADAATDLTDAGVRGLLNSLAAVDATRAEVCSFVGFLEDIGFSLSVRGKRGDGSQVLLGPVRDGSGKQLHLTRMRSPVLAHSLPASEPEPGVCAHKDALPSVVGHGQLLMKVEGVWACQHTANW